MEELNQLWLFIKENPILTVISTLFGVVTPLISLVAEIVKGIRRRNQRTLWWSYKNEAIIGPIQHTVDGIKIFLNNTPIDNLTWTSVDFCNDSHEELLSSQISKETPITIVFDEGVKVLGFDLDSNIGVESMENNRAVLVFPEHMKRYPILRISMLHTGDKYTGLDIEGHVINRKIQADANVWSKRSRWPMLIFLLFSASIMVVLFYFSDNDFEKIKQALIMYAVIALPMIILNLFLRPKSKRIRGRIQKFRRKLGMFFINWF